MAGNYSGQIAPQPSEIYGKRGTSAYKNQRADGAQRNGGVDGGKEKDPIGVRNGGGPTNSPHPTKKVLFTAHRHDHL
jgi:hypothetical protein